MEHILLFMIGPFILLLLGTIFFIIGFSLRKRINNWYRSKGIIVKRENNYTINIGGLLNQKNLVESIPDRRPTVQYTIDGVEYEHKSKIGQEPGFKPGTMVNIFYNPDDPEQVVIDSFAQRGTVFLVIGSILLGLGLIITIVMILVILNIKG